MSLRLDSLYVTGTYAGCYEDVPPIEHTIDMAKKRAEELWGKRPAYVVTPTVRAGMLPRWRYMAWVNGPAIDGGDGSQLVVIWWHDEAAMSEADVLMVAEAINWKAHAGDWWI